MALVAVVAAATKKTETFSPLLPATGLGSFEPHNGVYVIIK